MADTGKNPPKQARGPLGDARPDAQRDDPRASPGLKPAPVEDRPTVGTVKPEDYPAEDRDRANVAKK